MAGPYEQHLARGEDLITPPEAIRSGFVALALEKNRQSTPTIEQARALYATATRIGDPRKLVTAVGLEAALLTAAGISDKALKYLNPEDRSEAVEGLVANFLDPAGGAWVEELVYRFLLIRGDSMGGKLRNIVGVIAKQRLTRSILAALALGGRPFRWLHLASGPWIEGDVDDVDIEGRARAFAWKVNGTGRVLAYNLNVPLVQKNIDVSLLASGPEDALQKAYKVPNAYLALGELKGGIDPSGADEHWKTANTALSRVRGAFTGAGCFPRTFFVGAAIVNNMSKELWGQLESGQLSNAANLTQADQVGSLSSWLIGL